MAASTYFAQVQQLYIAYFGRPADTIGLNFWANSIDAANGSIAAVQAGFSASAESQALFGNKSTIDKVTAIYQNAFGRAPEPAGLAFWVARLDSGAVTQAQASWTIQQSAGAGDAAVVQAKLVAAQAFTAQIDTTAEIQGYQGTAAADSARAFLATVNSAATGNTAVANAASALASAVAVGGTPGSTFTLTTAVDTLTGTTGNDTFNAVVDSVTATATTLTAADKIVGGAGVDTLSVTTVGAAANVTNSADITGVEVLAIRATGGTATVTDASGFTAVNTVRSASDVVIGSTTGLASGASVGINATTAGAVTATYAAAATAATLNVSNTATAGAVTLNGGTALTTATINSIGGANTLGGVTFAGTGVNALTVNATSNITTGTIAGVAANTAITVSGAGTANIGALNANVTSVNGSTNSGGVTTTLNNSTALQFTGGAGNDVVTTAVAYVAANTAVIAAGAGTLDRLVVADATHLTAVSGAKYTGFEVLQTSAQNVNLNFISGITKIVAAGAVTLDNVTTAQSGNIVLNADATPVINVVGATTVGQIDTLKVAIDNELPAVASLNFANVTAAGVENVEFTLTENATFASVAGLASASSLKFAGAGNLNLTFDAATVVNSKIDASAVTGTVTINASTATGSNGVSITGSATKVNVLTGTANADVLVGGAVNDTLNVGAADTATGGAGANSFVFALPAAPGAAAAVVAAAATITDFSAGTGNKIDFTPALTLVAHTTTAVSGTASVSATGLTTFNTADNTLALKVAALSNATAADAAGASAVFTDSGSTYVFVNTDATGTNADVLIKLTGVTGTTGLTLTGGDITAVA